MHRGSTEYASLGISPGAGFTVCAVEPARFTPDADRYANLTCYGVRIILSDRAQLDVARLGLELAAALYRLYPTRFRLDETLSLVGSRKVLAAIGSGDDPRDVIAMWRTELAAFEERSAQIPAYPTESD